MVASDRISAFDHVLDTPIPDKGRILTAMSVWWFDQLRDLVPNHLISHDDPAIPTQWRGRAIVCRELAMVPGRGGRAGLPRRVGAGRLHARPVPSAATRSRPGCATATGCPSRSSRPRPRRRWASTTRTSVYAAIVETVGASSRERAARADPRGVRTGRGDRRRARDHPGRHQVRVRPRRRRARWCSATRCSPRTRRGSGRPTAGSRATRSPASTSSTCATGCCRRRRAGTATAARRHRRCPRTWSRRRATRYVEAYERLTGLAFDDWLVLRDRHRRVEAVLAEVRGDLLADRGERGEIVVVEQVDQVVRTDSTWPGAAARSVSQPMSVSTT